MGGWGVGGGQQSVSGRPRLVTVTCAPSCPVSSAAVSTLTLPHVFFLFSAGQLSRVVVFFTGFCAERLGRDVWKNLLAAQQELKSNR